MHSLYLLEAFLGDISDVQLTLGPPANDGCPLFKEWRAVVRCAGGSGHINLSWNVKPLQDLLLVHGTQGTIRADIFGMSVTKRTVMRVPQHAERILNSVREGCGIAAQAVTNVGRVATRRLLRYHGLNMLVADFYAAIATGSPSPVTVEQARNVVKWTEQVAAVADDAKEQHVRRACSAVNVGSRYRRNRLYRTAPYSTPLIESLRHDPRSDSIRATGRMVAGRTPGSGDGGPRRPGCRG